MGNREWYDDEVYMRVAEMYLINAEANVRDNNLQAAKTSLKHCWTNVTLLQRKRLLR